MDPRLIIELIIAVGGIGGIVAWLRERRENRVSKADIEQRLRDYLGTELDRLRSRVDALEKEVDQESRARLKSDLRAMRLLAMVNELRARLTPPLPPLSDTDI